MTVTTRESENESDGRESESKNDGEKEWELERSEREDEVARFKHEMRRRERNMNSVEYPSNFRGQFYPKWEMWNIF